jgi:hypothetical protein
MPGFKSQSPHAVPSWRAGHAKPWGKSDVIVAAESLHVHPHTFRYRRRRLSEVDRGADGRRHPSHEQVPARG